MASALYDALSQRVATEQPTTWTVIEGPYPGSLNQGDAIAVGVGDESISVTRDPMPGLGRAYLETVRVVCSAWSWAGDTEMRPRRARCHELLTIVAEVCAADPTLGGVTEQAGLEGEQSWLQRQSGGASVSVGFIVACKAVV